MFAKKTTIEEKRNIYFAGIQPQSVTFGLDTIFSVEVIIKISDDFSKFTRSPSCYSQGERVLKVLLTFLIVLVCVFVTPLKAAGKKPLKLLKTLEWHSQYILDVKFSPDGKVLAVCGGEKLSDSGRVKMWNANSWKQKNSLKFTNTLVYSMDYSPDGRMIAFGCFTGKERLYDISTGKLRVVAGDRGVTVKFASDSKTFAVSELGQSVRLFDINNGKLLKSKSMNGRFDTVESQVAFSPKGRWIAISRTDRLRKGLYQIEICDANTLKTQTTLRADSGLVTSLAFSADERLLYSGDEDGMVIVWDMKSQKQRAIFRAFSKPDYTLFSVILSPDGKLLATAGINAIKLWDISDSNQLVYTVEGKGGFSVAFSPDGKLLATTTSSIDDPPTIKIWSLPDRK